MPGFINFPPATPTKTMTWREVMNFIDVNMTEEQKDKMAKVFAIRPYMDGETDFIDIGEIVNEASVGFFIVLED